MTRRLFGGLRLWESVTGSSMPQLFGKTIYRGKTDKKQIALTYDDGPDRVNTPVLLDLLKEYDARATFFVVGASLENNEDIVRRMIREGHDVGNHSWSHRPLLCQEPDDILAEISKTDAAIRKYGYQRDIPFRAPYGKKMLVLPYLLSRHDRFHIYWDVVPGDWNQIPADKMLADVTEKISRGSIVLLHDGDMTSNRSPASRAETLELTRMLLEKYHGLGYDFVTVTSMMT